MAVGGERQNEPIDWRSRINGRAIDCRELDSLAQAARRGCAQPHYLSTSEVQAICKALVIHLAQMGIG